MRGADARAHLGRHLFASIEGGAELLDRGREVFRELRRAVGMTRRERAGQRVDLSLEPLDATLAVGEATEHARET